MFDYHMHTANSFDGKNTASEMAAAAYSNGIKEICFTDHQEIDYPAPDESAEIGLLNKEKYIKDIIAAREEVPQIKIKFGLETGLIGGSLEKIAADAKSAPFDFIIASQHVAAGLDPYFGKYFRKFGLDEGRLIYLKEVYENIKNYDEFDVVGHIGYLEKYLDRNGFDGEQTFVYSDYSDIIDEILESVIRRGKGIEVNTSNYKVHGTPNPHPTIIERYRELGGEIITTGSDAHTANDVGANFKQAYELLKSVGFKYVCTYEQRKPIFKRIDN